MSEESFIQNDVENKQLKEENENEKLEIRKEKVEMTNENKQFKKITQLKKNQKR